MNFCCVTTRTRSCGRCARSWAPGTAAAPLLGEGAGRDGHGEGGRSRRSPPVRHLAGEAERAGVVRLHVERRGPRHQPVPGRVTACSAEETVHPEVGAGGFCVVHGLHHVAGRVRHGRREDRRAAEGGEADRLRRRGGWTCDDQPGYESARAAEARRNLHTPTVHSISPVDETGPGGHVEPEPGGGDLREGRGVVLVGGDAARPDVHVGGAVPVLELARRRQIDPLVVVEPVGGGLTDVLRRRPAVFDPLGSLLGSVAVDAVGPVGRARRA